MKIALGTVQFGSKYGVANTNGKTSHREVVNILNYARDVGIDLLDTAAVYGESESVLGQTGVSDWRIVTKVPPMDQEVELKDIWLIDQVKKSLDRLGIDSLAGLLLHKPEDLLTDKSGKYLKALQQLKNEGLVRKVGYSIYCPSILTELTKIFWPDVVQAPFNVFDQRLVRSGWLSRLKERDTEVHVRSVLLQGLLQMSPESRPKYFDRWASAFSRWDRETLEVGISPVSAAYSFVFQEDGIDKVIVGVETLSHLQYITGVYRNPLKQLVHGINCDDSELLDPFNWKLN